MSVVKYDELDRDLPVSSNLRLYPVVQDTSNRMLYLNIFRSYNVSDEVYNNESLFDYYTVIEDDWLENISSIHYNTPYLWWVVALFNKIDNPFEELQEGKVLRILKYTNIYAIFDDIAELESL
jgi:hypothetical protein